MNKYTLIIGYLIAISALLIIGAGYAMFHEMNASLLREQEDLFRVESESKIKSFNDSLLNIAQNFASYAELPSFKSMRYYELTLNQLSVDDNKRQLELFFFDMSRNDNYLKAVTFVDDDGKAIFKIDQFSILSKLAHVSLQGNLTHVLEANLKPRDFHVQIISGEFNNLEALQWWLPVYVSTNKRMGHLVFDVDISLIQDEIIKISETGLNVVFITNEHDDLFHGEYQLASESLHENVISHADNWVNSSELPLKGLSWKISVAGEKSAHIKGITEMRAIINFGFAPVIILILSLLFYMFRKKVESDKQIHHLAYYDSLTGLVNRHQFDKALNIALTETHEHDVQHALLYLDLDQFKVVNDTSGHLAGDKLLEQLAVYLKHSVRESDMLARLGGDEFALLLNVCPEEMALRIANKILTAVSDFRFVWKDKSFSIGVSIGVVFISSSDETCNTVLRKADLACYMAKELGRNRIHVYADDDQTLGERHGEMQWVSRIKQAIEEDRFFLVAQRILPLADENNSDKHYEILVRLNDDGRVVLPGAFIPAAERYGIMLDVDMWVIDKAFSFMQRYTNLSVAQDEKMFFSINVSGVSLGDKKFLPYIQERFLQYKIPHECICFEITETAAIANFSVAMNFIESIKSLGCNLSLDDFGSGLCSFTYLKTIPVDYLKIDGSFVTRMLDNSLDMAIVVAIKQISLATKSKVIAEFVTSEEIKNKLNEIGVDYVQGNGVAEPVNINRLLDFKVIKSAS